LTIGALVGGISQGLQKILLGGSAEGFDPFQVERSPVRQRHLSGTSFFGAIRA
jgi:hypothetical protein